MRCLACNKYLDYTKEHKTYLDEQMCYNCTVKSNAVYSYTVDHAFVLKDAKTGVTPPCKEIYDEC